MNDTPAPAQRQATNDLTLAAAFYAFVEKSPSERRARIDLIDAIRDRRIKHAVAVARRYVDGLPPQKPQITRGWPIPRKALRSPGLEFDMENSSARWRDPITRTLYRFEGISVSHPPFASQSPGIDAPPPRPRGAPPKFDWDIMVAELIRDVHERGVVGRSDRQIARDLTEWAEREWSKAPDFDTVRPHVIKWLSRLRRG